MKSFNDAVLHKNRDFESGFQSCFSQFIDWLFILENPQLTQLGQIGFVDWLEPTIVITVSGDPATLLSEKKWKQEWQESIVKTVKI